MWASTNEATERGQVTILLVAVVVVFAVATVGLARYGQAVTNRMSARTAADSIALAAAVDPRAAQEIEQWYEQQGMAVTRDGGHAVVQSGPSAAAAWATSQASELRTAPALVAIVARAEQLRGERIRPTRWGDVWIELGAAGATQIRPVAAELGLCEEAGAAADNTVVRFVLC